MPVDDEDELVAGGVSSDVPAIVDPVIWLAKREIPTMTGTALASLDRPVAREN